MRVILILEPVVFRGKPTLLESHFFWVNAIRRCTEHLGGRFALAANDATCRAWSVASVSARTFALPSYEVLADFGNSLHAYSRALYSPPPEAGRLERHVQAIRDAFLPDLAIMTSQNALIRRGLGATPILSIEQSPLPRLGYPVRTGFDPAGHQTSSMLEKHAGSITSLPVPDEQRLRIREVITDVVEKSVRSHPRGKRVRNALQAVRQRGKVALLVTQPTGWGTFEGAYDAVGVEELLVRWSLALPSGWIGVPTYHPAFQVDESAEQELSRACGNLHFLPRSLSVGTTELLVPDSDGMVTVSSTSTTSALLHGKPAIVVGRSPFKAWCGDDFSRLEAGPSLKPTDADGLFVYLTGRSTLLQRMCESAPSRLAEVLVAAASPGAEDWFLDPRGWDIGRARALFPGITARRGGR